MTAHVSLKNIITKFLNLISHHSRVDTKGPKHHSFLVCQSSQRFLFPVSYYRIISKVNYEASLLGHTEQNRHLKMTTVKDQLCPVNLVNYSSS